VLRLSVSGSVSSDGASAGFEAEVEATTTEASYGTMSYTRKSPVLGASQNQLDVVTYPELSDHWDDEGWSIIAGGVAADPLSSYGIVMAGASTTDRLDPLDVAVAVAAAADQAAASPLLFFQPARMARVAATIPTTNAKASVTAAASFRATPTSFFAEVSAGAEARSKFGLSWALSPVHHKSYILCLAGLRICILNLVCLHRES
jgi:hypothetical protein